MTRFESSRGWPSGEVVAAAQSGDPVALEALILGSHPHVVRFANSLSSSREDAEDAAQEALTVLYRRVGSLRVAAALSSWAFQVVKHECVRRTRSAVRHHKSATLVGTLASSSDRVTAEEVALGRLEAQRVAHAIAALPVAYQQVLVMRDLQSLSGGEVAQRLGMSKPAMKSVLHRARHALRDQLSEPNPCGF
jgi:RNA polymerase sigma factor (sigma-70 family)